MYEAVSAYPDGESTVSRLAKTAADYGFEGIVVRTGSSSSPEFDAEAIAAEYEIDVVDGVEIRTENPQQASGSVGQCRSSNTIVTVQGGTNAMNRFAVETDMVDVLSDPMADAGDFNHVLAKAAADNGVRVEFSLGSVLRASGGYRVRVLQSLTKLRELVDYYDTPYVVSGSPRSHLELRAPRELCALGEEIGFSRTQIEAGLREWGRLADRNRRVNSESFIEPGVERTRYETDR